MIKFKEINYRHYICIGITIISLLFSIFYFKYADNRLFESFIDIKNSSLFYISNLFELNLKGNLTINDFTSCPFELPFNLPNNWEDFKLLCRDYWNLFCSKENLNKYFSFLANGIYYVSKILLVVLPILLIVIIIKHFKSDNQDNDYNEDTKALKFFKNKFEKKVYLPVKFWFIRFFYFLKDNNIYLKIWLVIWLYNFNGFAIVIELLAYYLFFVCSFKTSTIYIQVLKILYDLSVIINFIPGFIWCIIIYLLINKLCISIGYDKLDHMEYCNRGYINERPIVSMQCGTMGSRKTTVITDMALSQEIMFRDEAFKRILKCDLMFPFFPWINLENDIKNAIKNHNVYNLATCKRYAKSKAVKFKKHKHIRNIYMYDFKRYNMTYDDNLKINDIWDVIETYTQLYFVYIIQSSLLISNYSIRVDNILNDIGNFPLWHSELFRNNPQMSEAFSRHAHILDFDMLRLGKKVLEFNEKANVFEFGVIVITEIGKERQNTVELREIKKSDKEANQKNDLFNTELKMIRHSATIDNFPFVKIITDEQRPESWGADARDLCEIVFSEKCSEIKFTRPLYFIYDFFIDMFIKGFKKRYYEARFNRGSNTLPMYLYHGFISLLNRYKVRNVNTFGYYKLDVIVENGRQDGKVKESNYYLSFKKCYSDRFSTDAFSDFFNVKALKSRLGLDDLEEYKTTKASFEEMDLQNSYFFNDLNKIKEE